MKRVWTEEEKQRMSETQKAVRAREQRRTPVVFPPPRRSGVCVDCTIRLDMDDMTRHLSREQIHAIMHGMAQVLAVGGIR